MITYLARRIDGKSPDRVFVTFPPQIDDLVAASEDEPRICALFCDRPFEWYDTLTFDSKAQLLVLTAQATTDYFSKVHSHMQRRLHNSAAVANVINKFLKSKL
jgi:hypothetical protein